MASGMRDDEGFNRICYETSLSRNQRHEFPPERLEGTVDPKLLEVLLSADQGVAEFDAAKQDLIVPRSSPIRDGIPIMLPEEARKIE
jgi:uncharacterized protein YbaR (Trm112 family)